MSQCLDLLCVTVIAIKLQISSTLNTRLNIETKTCLYTNLPMHTHVFLITSKP